MGMKNDSFKTMIRFSALSLVFSLGYIWVAYAFLQVSYDKIMSEQSYFMARTVKQMHETQVNGINLIEKNLNIETRMKLFLIKDKIKEAQNFELSFLEKLKEQYRVSDIYVIDDTFKIIASTAKNDIGLDIKQFYSDDKETHAKWLRDLKYMIKRENGLRIDAFTQETLPPHRYRKWAYIGGGEIKGVGNIIVEISISVDDIFQQRLSADLLPDYDKVIKDIEIQYESPFKNTKQTSKQTIKDDGTIDIIFVFVVFSIYVRMRFSIFMFRKDER